MWRVFVKCGLIGITCFINLAAITGVFCPLLGFKANVIKIVLVFWGIICLLGVIGLHLYFKDIDSCALKRVIHLLDRVSLVLCLICVCCAAVKIGIVNAERGTTLYDIIYLPAFAPVIAGTLLSIAEKIA